MTTRAALSGTHRNIRQTTRASGLPTVTNPFPPDKKPMPIMFCATFRDANRRIVSTSHNCNITGCVSLAAASIFPSSEAATTTPGRTARCSPRFQSNNTTVLPKEPLARRAPLCKTAILAIGWRWTHHRPSCLPVPRSHMYTHPSSPPAASVRLSMKVTQPTPGPNILVPCARKR